VRESERARERERRRRRRLLGEVRVQRPVDARDDLLELEDHPLDPRLRKGVVVLDLVEQPREAPVRVGLHLREVDRRHRVDVLLRRRPVLRRRGRPSSDERERAAGRSEGMGTAQAAEGGGRRWWWWWWWRRWRRRRVAWPDLRQVRREEDHEERRDQVVDALHVARRRVAERPDVQDALERAPHRLGLEDARRGRAAARGARRRVRGNGARGVCGRVSGGAGGGIRGEVVGFWPGAAHVRGTSIRIWCSVSRWYCDRSASETSKYCGTDSQYSRRLRCSASARYSTFEGR